MFLGYSPEFKTYRLYSPINGKVITSRDVKFDEAESWNWTNNCVDQVSVQQLPFKENSFTSPQANQDLPSPPNTP